MAKHRIEEGLQDVGNFISLFLLSLPRLFFNTLANLLVAKWRRFVKGTRLGVRENECSES